MEDKPNELTFIYCSDKEQDNKIKAFIESLPGYVVRLVDLVRESMSEKQLSELASKMKVRIEDLIDPVFNHRISVHNEGLILLQRKKILTLMSHDPKILHTPLVMIGNKACKFASAYELLRKSFGATN